MSTRLHPFFRLLICVVGCVAAQVIVLLVIAAATAVAATLQGQGANVQFERFLNGNLLLVNLFVYPPTLLWLWFCRRFFDRCSFVSLGLRRHGFVALLGAGFLGGFLACALIFGVLVLSGQAHVSGWSLAAQSGGVSSSLLLLLGWLAMMVTVGYMEEVTFRGYALQNLHAWLGAKAAIFLQAVAFAFIHFGNLLAQTKSAPDTMQATLQAMPNIALIGIFFALCYHRTGSLWFPIGFHAAWNFSLGSVFSLPVSGIPIFHLLDVKMSGPTLLTGGSFGPEASLLLTPLLLALCFVAARGSDHALALGDLQALQTEAPATEVLASETPIAAEERTHENRFRTRMGKATRELDAETMATLRALNQQSTVQKAEHASPFDIASQEASTPIETPSLSSIAPEPSTPPLVEVVASLQPQPQPTESKPEAHPEPSTPPRKATPRW
jgi:membrane protease YdiL (CAAX protease family)